MISFIYSSKHFSSLLIIHECIYTLNAPRRLRYSFRLESLPLYSNFSTLLVIYIDCRDAYEQGLTQSGVYTIQPDSEPAFQAYCDMTTDGGGWTVFQRRQDGSQDFYLYWTDYENGFGNFSNEFWLGLAQMHRLTASTARTELRVDLVDFSNDARHAQYTDFGIGNASSNRMYVLTVANYSGTAGDSLNGESFSDGVHHNQPFSTRDGDGSSACAQQFMGAWWYRGCYQSNLNGLYYSSPVLAEDGVIWSTFQDDISLKFSEMKLRRA